jgi:hypothetical protein
LTRLIPFDSSNRAQQPRVHLAYFPGAC